VIRVRPTPRKEQVLPFKPPLLARESAEEFARLSEALHQEVKPVGVIVTMYVNDLACIIWEIIRLRRCKTAIVNLAFGQALEKVLGELMRKPNSAQEVETLAVRWFTDEKAKAKVADLLAKFGLDESALEAEAIRQSSADLEVLEKMLSSLASRRDKSLACIAAYRLSFANQLRESASRIIEGNTVVELQ
jgi:hypothetical protein